MTVGLRGFPNGNSLVLPDQGEAGEPGGATAPPVRSDDPHQARGVGPQRPTGGDGAAPGGMFRLGKATVVEIPGSALDLGRQPPVVIDAGWLSAQLWRAVLGK